MKKLLPRCGLEPVHGETSGIRECRTEPEHLLELFRGIDSDDLTLGWRVRPCERVLLRVALFAVGTPHRDLSSRSSCVKSFDCRWQCGNGCRSGGYLQEVATI